MSLNLTEGETGEGRDERADCDIEDEENRHHLENKNNFFLKKKKERNEESLRCLLLSENCSDIDNL